jgi:ribosomal protein S18 acetylase RimI-like enzyme
MDPNTPGGAPARIQSSIRSFFQSKTTSAAPTMPLVVQSTQRNQVSQPPPASDAADNSPLPAQAKIVPITHDHIQPLRRINSLLLPINYPDSFYNKILDPAQISVSRVILWEDLHSKETKVVGGIVCRLDPSPSAVSGSQASQAIEASYDVYLQSLVLLSPYREKGLAAAALRNVIEAATQLEGVRVRGLYAHVWTDNTDALRWYSARAFQKDEVVIHGYYKRLKPDTAWILRRDLVPSDHLTQSTDRLQQNIVSVPPGLNEQQSNTTKEVANQRPASPPRTQSFQDRRPDMEWNDLPEDVLSGSLLKPPTPRSGEGSSASSRSTSRSGLEGKGRKKMRAYPAAAFGS